MAKVLSNAQVRDVAHRCAGDADLAAATVAGQQRGAITTAQLGLVGLGRGAIRRRRERSQLHTVYRGVHLLGHAVPPPGGMEVAALLACRRRALLAEGSAMSVWGFGPGDPDAIHVLVLGGAPRSRPGLIVHRSQTLLRNEITTCRGLPITTPLRTLLDLAAIAHPRLETVVANAHAGGFITAETLSAYAGTRTGAPGARRLRELAGLEQRGYTRSENERQLRTLCGRAGLPAPRTGVILHGYEVDAHWPDYRLVVEVDAHNTHAHLSQFEHDRRKHNDLVARGETVLHITDRVLHGEPLRAIADIARTMRA